ncbi:unnamed protein product [Rotaria sp. Silwood1]|nr:unnamed protein product [Rotaria sp. Silwood1]CAF4990696.1 unnamed protein product [Rotaria sp. Silwood1]
MISYPPLSILNLPSTIFCSLNLTKLCIYVDSLDDCLYLLDGHLKQLTTFIVQMNYIGNNLSIIHNTDDLFNLKCFSLTCYNLTNEYDNRVIPLFRRMKNLEKLTLYIRLVNLSTFVDGTHLHKKILMHMPQLHAFTFYISTMIEFNDSFHLLVDNDLQQTFTNIGYYQTSSTVNYCRESKAICHVFSLPFTFNRLEMITNRFPTIIFHHVTYLQVFDKVQFKHKFFNRIAKAFSLLKYFTISSKLLSLIDFNKYEYDYIQSYPIIQFSHLISLNMMVQNPYYIEQFLLNTKTHLPRLIELKLSYSHLKNVTKNFTRDATRHNCANIKRLIFCDTCDFPTKFSYYFPFLNTVSYITSTR